MDFLGQTRHLEHVVGLSQKVKIYGESSTIFCCVYNFSAFYLN